MKTRVSWKEKLDRASAPKNPHIDEAPPQWVGGEVGKTMVIPSAWELDAMVRKIPPGETTNVRDLRNRYAKAHGADITCPLTTGIFLRIIAEYAEEQSLDGIKNVTPYWRVVTDNGKMPPKIQAIFDLHHSRSLA